MSNAVFSGAADVNFDNATFNMVQGDQYNMVHRDQINLNLKAGRLKLQGISEMDSIIALIGPTGSGKSTFINIATQQRSKTVSFKLKSSTSAIRAVRFFHPQDGRPIVFVDTPGFSDSRKSDIEILRIIADWLEKTYKRKINLTGIIYLHRICDNRMTASSLKNLDMLAKLCGEDAIKKVILATTMWGDVKDGEFNDRQNELEESYWKDMLTKGATAARFQPNTFNSAWNIVNILVGKHSEQSRLLIQQEMVDLGLHLSETQAGITLYSDEHAKQRETILQLRDKARIQNHLQLVEELDVQYEEIRENIRKTFDQVQRPLGRRILSILFGYIM